MEGLRERGLSVLLLHFRCFIVHGEKRDERLALLYLHVILSQYSLTQQPLKLKLASYHNVIYQMCAGYDRPVISSKPKENTPEKPVFPSYNSPELSRDPSAGAPPPALEPLL